MIRHRSVSGLLVLFVALSCAGALLTASRAAAVFEEITETGDPGVLRISVDSATPLWAQLAPGDTAHWLVEAELRGAPQSTLAVELVTAVVPDELRGLTARVESCAGSFTFQPGQAGEAICSSAAVSVLAPTRLDALPRDGRRVELAQLWASEPRQLLVTLALPATADPQAFTGRLAIVGLGVHASGELTDPAPAGLEPVPPPVPSLGGGSLPASGSVMPLAVTGADALPLSTLAVGLLGVGTVLALRRRSGARS
ncbi:hypothetical protein [Leucobacter sp. VD1]|uniref:hypothetical protein n=1 Tax=Leucobacter sp. VD1 TaxID=3080381 RepID=UPI0030177346